MNWGLFLWIAGMVMFGLAFRFLIPFDRKDRPRTPRERLIGVGLVVVSMGTLALSVALFEPARPSAGKAKGRPANPAVAQPADAAGRTP
jgi:hypothetical protein